MLDELNNAERREMGALRVRDAAFDAVLRLWKQRKNEGLTQKELSDFLEKDPAWVSKNLSGPGNWTLKTIGAFAEALNGHIDINITPIEQLRCDANYDFYLEFDRTCAEAFKGAQQVEVKAEVKNDIVLIYAPRYNNNFKVSR